VRFHHSSSGSGGLWALILIFVLLIGLIVVFSQQILASLGNPDSQGNIILFLAAIILPLILLGIIIYQINRLIGERREKRPGSLLKTKLVFFFALIALLSSIPQALLSVNFINSTISFWTEAEIGTALKGGLSISLDYFQGVVGSLESFSESSTLTSLLRDLGRNNDRLWRNVQAANSNVQFLQVFDGQGTEVLFKGNPEARLQDFDILADTEGILPKEDRAELSILRSVSRQSVAGAGYRVVVGALLSEGFAENARRLTESLETFNQLNVYKRLFQTVLLVFYAFFSFPIFLLSILVSFLLTEELIRPIVNLEDATRRVAEGDYSFRILTRSGDELSTLVGSFNRMIAELSHTRQQIVQAEKISAWQEIAQRLAHEIKNPLTPIKLSAQRILKRYQAGPLEIGPVLEPAVAAIIEEVDNLNKLLGEFREFARLPGPQPETVNILQLVEEVAAMYKHIAGRVDIDLSHLKEDIFLNADRNQLKQVFANLLKNGIQAMPGGGTILVRCDVVGKENRDYCRIWIEDTGTGIREEYHDQVFRPYFTTKKDGTGLGLAIVERVVFDHHGSIRFETQAGLGTTFIIDLPMES
jgi:two-component system nitrogen regulation sensor histidine kinase NtrY